MTIDQPSQHQLPQLRQLWKEAFADEDAFLDSFFRVGYAPERCRCLTLEDQVCAVLYWFDAQFEDQKIAYLYAVATAKSHQKQGLCRRLMEDTHRHLTALGYDLAVLVPCGPELFAFYEKLGYLNLSAVEEYTCQAAGSAAAVRCVSAEEYAALRRNLLPRDAVIQEGVTLAFLQTFCTFYAGNGFLLAGYTDKNRLIATEFLGEPSAAPGILKALDIPEGKFRMPGSQMPFAMYRQLTENALPLPAYFGLALD